jgi:hypothetical protein
MQVVSDSIQTLLCLTENCKQIAQKCQWAGWGVAQVVEHLSSKNMALSSFPATTKKKTKQKEQKAMMKFWPLCQI